MRKATSHASTGNVRDYDSEKMAAEQDEHETSMDERPEPVTGIHGLSIVKKRSTKKKNRCVLLRPERSSSKVETGTYYQETPYCPIHEEQIRFMCLSRGCMRELCSYCILEHQAHINSIKTVEEVIKDAFAFYKKFDPVGAQETVMSVQNANMREIDSMTNDFLSYFDKKISQLKMDIIAQDQKLIENVTNKEIFLSNSKQSSSKKIEIDHKQLSMLQNYLRSDSIQEIPLVKLEVDSYMLRFSDVFDDSVKVITNGVSIESTDHNVPKILHWFEWNKKKLYLYDVLKNSSTIVDLQINFKIPSYSRSVQTPCGKIFLLGGEEPELNTRDDVYMFDTCTASCGLTLRSPMMHKKYDFTCCVLDGFIYVISGRDTSAEIVDRCERYDYTKDQWSSIAPVKKKRYAASCASVSGLKKIYLFGGRTESNNNMLEDIEEYDVATDVWKLVMLKDPAIWVPVEVSAMIQVDEDKLLIFGGSDSRVKDSPNSYIFNVSDYSLERTEDLKRAQVFVAAPVCYGRKIYAVGNEYYVKNRSLNRFHIDTREWTIIF